MNNDIYAALGGMLLIMTLMVGAVFADRYFTLKCVETYANSTKTALEISTICK